MRTAIFALAAAVACALVGACAGTFERDPADDADARCFDCHARYRTETVAATHRKHGHGCAACHGASEAHAADPKGHAAPDVMVPRTEINLSCMNRGRHPPDALAREEGHRAIFPEPAHATKTCTDCHGKHRMKTRSVRWDRATGEQIPAPMGSGE